MPSETSEYAEVVVARTGDTYVLEISMDIACIRSLDDKISDGDHFADFRIVPKCWIRMLSIFLLLIWVASGCLAH